MDGLTKEGCAEVRITPWMVCSRVTQERLPSASTDRRIYDALPIVSTSYEDNTPLEIL